MSVFTANDIKRYEDYGRLYKSLAFYLRSDIENGIVEGYNSRPRDMINNVLQDIQKGSVLIDREKLLHLLNTTLKLKKSFGSIPNADYVIDAIIPFVDQLDTDEKIEKTEPIFSDELVKKTLEKSPATTSNVNERLCRVKELLMEK